MVGLEVMEGFMTFGLAIGYLGSGGFLATSFF